MARAWLLALLPFVVLTALAAPARAWAAVSVADPRVVQDSSMTSGQVTTWDCVWLGSYPQTYVDDAATVAELDAASGWDAEGDLTYGGATYRRLQESDATCSSTSSEYWSWGSKASAAGYCYFRWEPVKWRVLESDGTSALVVADVALDDQRYNETYTDVTWETCTLRGWLNGEFWGDCLTAAQQGAVVEQALANDDNIDYGTPGGAETTDSVFLLAESDVWSGGSATRHGFATAYGTHDEARRCKTSDYAHAMGTWTWNSTSTSSLGNCYWWLRSPGYSARYAAFVLDGAHVNRYGRSVDIGYCAVRPALRISTSSNQISYAGTVSSNGDVDEQGRPGGGYDSYDLSNAQVSTISVQSYTGDPVEPDFTVRMGLSTLLRKDKDYTVSYSDNVEVGTAKVTITGAGDYHGSISRTFMISTEANVLWAGKKLDLGFDSTSFTLDDDVPILGGDTFNLDFPVELPIQTVFEDGKVKVGINLPEPYLKGSGSSAKAWEWTTERKGMKEQWEDFCKDAHKTKDLFKGGYSGFLKKISDGRWKRWNVPGMSKSAEVFVAGYLEYAYGERLSDAARLEGSIVITAKGSATAQKQWVVWVIPVTGSITFSAEGTATGTLAWDIANSSWSGDLQLAVAIGLEPYVGVGVGQWASVGVYGSGKTGVDLTILSRTEPLGLREWYLYGEAGGRAYFAKKAFTWTIISTADLRKGRLAQYTDSDGHLRLWSKTQASLITGSKGAGRRIQSVDAGEELLSSAETLPLTDEEPLRAAASSGLLVDGAYPGAEPAVLDVSGTKVLVYVGQDISRPELDQTVLYYRVYDPDASTWGDPVPVLDDGTADCMPTVLVDGDDAYVAWLDATEAFGEGADVDAAAYMASFLARVACWDADSGSFADLGRPAGDGANYAYLVALGAGESGLVATWAENADGAAFGLSAGNSVRQATINGTAWSEPVTLAEGLNAVTSLAARGGQAAWAVDEDNDLATTGQLVASTAGQLPAGDVAALSYAELPGVEGTVLAANVGGGLSYYDGSSWAEVLPEGTMSTGSAFCVDGSSVYYVQASEDASHVAVATYDGGEWGNALVTTDDGYVDSLSDPCGTVALTHTTATLVEETGEWDTISEVRVLPSKERADVALEAADFVPADLAPGATVPVTLYVTNEGTSRMTYAYWGATLDGVDLASGTAEVDLMPGEIGSFEVELALPDDLGGGALSFWAAGDGDDDAGDGVQEAQIVRPDLEVTAEFLEGVSGVDGAEGSKPLLVVTVTNVGTAAADATTTVSDEAGSALLTEAGTIAAGESVTYTKEFSSDDGLLPADGSEAVLIARAVTDAEEFYDSNNVDYAIASMRYLNAEGKVVDAGGGGSNTDDDTPAPSKARSSISLAAHTKTYTGKALAYSGKVTRSGSTGKVTYAYYSDAACTKEVRAADVIAAGAYYVRATLAADDSHDGATSAAAKFIIAKADNPITAKGKSAKVKYSAAKKKARTLAVSKVAKITKAQGTKRFKVTKWTTSKAKKYIKVNAKTGKVTVKKGTPKGTYKFKLRVKAAGNANYKAGVKTVKVKVIVK